MCVCVCVCMQQCNGVQSTWVFAPSPDSLPQSFRSISVSKEKKMVGSRALDTDVLACVSPSMWLFVISGTLSSVAGHEPHRT